MLSQEVSASPKTLPKALPGTVRHPPGDTDRNTAKETDTLPGTPEKVERKVDISCN